MHNGLMPRLSEPVERKLFDAFGAGAKERSGGVVASFSCRDCGYWKAADRPDCYRRCTPEPYVNPGYDTFGITSNTVK